jgi:NAD(P)-dependent dehydrogenase (short-subunit alcohol dehydrogenase family)
MGSLDGRVAIITGAGRGIGRAYAEHFAAEGASVVVNDTDADEAAAVVAAVEGAGGVAVADPEDCADWDGGRRLVHGAVEAFGRLDVLVNNAGILRDRAIVNMAEDEWDDVVRVHLKGHFVPTRWAAEHWRAEHKAGRPVAASIVHTSSTSGLVGNPGQSNYGAAKAGIAAFAAISAQELGRYGVRSNCVCPAARTRLSETAPGIGTMIAAPADDRFDVW